MAPLKIALVGVLGIVVAASLAFADHQPNHPGGGDTGGAPAGYALMTCRIGNAVTLLIADRWVLISGGTDPDINTADDSCDLAIQKFLSVGWRLHLIEPNPLIAVPADADDRFYHFVSP